MSRRFLNFEFEFYFFLFRKDFAPVLFSTTNPPRKFTESNSVFPQPKRTVATEKLNFYFYTLAPTSIFYFPFRFPMDMNPKLDVYWTENEDTYIQLRGRKVYLKDIKSVKDTYPILKAYMVEEGNFVNTVIPVYANDMGVQKKVMTYEDSQRLARGTKNWNDAADRLLEYSRRNKLWMFRH